VNQILAGVLRELAKQCGTKCLEEAVTKAPGYLWGWVRDGEVEMRVGHLWWKHTHVVTRRSKRLAGYIDKKTGLRVSAVRCPYCG